MLPMFIVILLLDIYLSEVSNTQTEMSGSGTSLNNIADNFFHCGETPLWFPNNIQHNQIRVCQSCIVRIYAGKPGAIQALTPIPQGFLFDEHTLTSLVFNGLRYSLLESFLLLPGAHRLPGTSNPAEAELCFYFRADLNQKDFRCICLPIQIGSGVGNDYFSELGNSNKFPRKVTLESLFTSSTQMYMYLGSDFNFRRTSTIECLNTTKVTYMVATSPVYILEKDLMRLKSLNTLPSDQRKVFKPKDGAATTTRIQNLVIVVPNIKLGEKDTPVPSSKSENARVQIPDTVKLSQMKCRPLDEKKDIRDGTIYIGGEKRPGDSTLEDELQKAANLSKAWEETSVSIQPGDIENTIGGVLGIGIALFLVALISWIILSFVFREYKVTVRDLYDKNKNPVVGILLSMSNFTDTFTGKINKFLCNFT